MRIKGMVFSAILGAAAGMAAGRRKSRMQERGLYEYGNKYYDYFQLMNRWMACRNEGKGVEKYFEESGISKIAIYGMGDLADRLAEELQGSRINVVYGIDKEVCCTNSRVTEVYSLEDAWPSVDAIVITPFRAVPQIEQELRKKCPYRLLSLEEVIYSL